MIQFCISTQFSSIWHIDRNLLGALTPGQSGPESDGKAPKLLEPHHKIVYCHIQDTRSGESYPFAGMQSVYSTAYSPSPNCIVYILLIDLILILFLMSFETK